MLVVDSSVILATVLPDEECHYAETILTHIEEGSLTAWVPALFHLEIANVLTLAQKRQRISAGQTSSGIKAIGLLPLSVDTEAAYPAAMERIHPFMQTYDLTAYDACYLELAIRRRFQVATLDKSLRAACEKNGVCYHMQ